MLVAQEVHMAQELSLPLEGACLSAAAFPISMQD